MPAKNLSRIADRGTYCHIYNKGVEKSTIFRDKQDYEVFVQFLKDYLTPPVSSDSLKKTFTINGRSFKGTPHQPKNYFNKVELIAYRLRPSHFHLLLHQTEEGSIEKFLRSLSTRYSIYFNKKYHRTGTLFEGPYKSDHIKNMTQLLDTSLHLHRSPEIEIENDPGNSFSSYAEYVGKKETPWIKPDVILSLPEIKSSFLGGTGNYDDLVRNYKPTREQWNLLEDEPMKNELTSNNERVLSSNLTSHPDNTPTTLPIWFRLPEIAGITIVLLLLVALGVRNIHISKAQTLGVYNESLTLAPSISLPPPPPSPTPSSMPQTEVQAEKLTLVVKILDGSSSVNIRQSPTSKSERIGEAKNGDTLEYVSKKPGWYEIKLPDGSNAYISAKYVNLEKIEPATDQNLQ